MQAPMGIICTTDEEHRAVKSSQRGCAIIGLSIIGFAGGTLFHRFFL